MDFPGNLHQLGGNHALVDDGWFCPWLGARRRSVDAEKCRVRDVELGLVSLDEEVVRRLERGQVLERLGRIGGVKPESVAVACGR